MSTYEDKFSHFLDKNCHFLGILSAVNVLNDPELTHRLTVGGYRSSATVVFKINSHHLTKGHYTMLQRESSGDVEWFDPTGMLPPVEVVQWCEENNFDHPDCMPFPLHAPDRLFLSGEMCAYYVRVRVWQETMEDFQFKCYHCKVGDRTHFVALGIDFTE